MSNYTINPVSFVGNTGFLIIEVQVKGFWSNPAHIRVERQRLPHSQVEWKAEVKHSSGGYATDNSDISQLDAEQNFAEALLAAIKYARELEGRSEELEREYQIVAQRARSEHLAELAARQAAFEADVPLGDTCATEIVHAAIANKSRTIEFFRRASDRTLKIKCKRIASGITRFYDDGGVISRKSVIAILAQSSHRTYAHMITNTILNTVAF